MQGQTELKGLLIEHHEATVEMLWNKIYDSFRYLNDIAGLTTDSNVLEYLDNINREEPDYRQEITVCNKNIDFVLRRYMLEAAMLSVSVDYHVEPLEDISTETTIEIMKALGKCFEKIFDYRDSPRAFLHVKVMDDRVRIYAEKVESLVFDEELMLV